MTETPWGKETRLLHKEERTACLLPQNVPSGDKLRTVRYFSVGKNKQEVHSIMHRYSVFVAREPCGFYKT